MIYDFLYMLALVLSPLALPFSAKLREGFFARLALTARVRRACKGWDSVRWFHFASSGELEQCLPLLEELRKVEKDSKVFLSYFSPTAKRALALEKKRRENAGLPIPWDYADFSPFDLPLFILPLFQILKPK